MKTILESSLTFDDFTYEKVSNEAIVAYRKGSAFWMTLNNTGYRMFELVSQGLSEENIIDKLVKFYEIPKEYIQHDFLEFKREMKEKLHTCKEIEEKEKEKRAPFDIEKSITIHITNRCNLNCPYCYKDANSNLKELSKEDILRIINDAYQIGFKEFIFSGGEPTLRLDLFEILEIVYEKYPDCKFSLITNGTTDLDDCYIDIMVKTLYGIQISIDSSDEDVNRKTRGVDSVSKIKILSQKLAMRGYKSFYFACVPYTSGMGELANIKGIPQLLRLAAYSGAKGLYVNILKPNGRMSLEEYQKYDISEFWECVDECENELVNLYNIGYRELSLFAASDFKHILMEYKHKEGCSAGISEMAIDNDGNVYPCPSLMLPEYLFGNIHYDSLETIYRSMYDIFVDITVEHMEKCKDCKAKYICGGGCRAIAYALTNDIMSADPYCEQGKKRLELWQAVSLRIRPKKEG